MIVTRELLKNFRLRLVAQQIGRAELADDTEGVHSIEFTLTSAWRHQGPENTEDELRQIVRAGARPGSLLNPFLIGTYGRDSCRQHRSVVFSVVSAKIWTVAGPGKPPRWRGY